MITNAFAMLVKYISPFNLLVVFNGALQAPTFHLDGVPAINYGGLASRVGWELANTIDNEGTGMILRILSKVLNVF